MEYVTSRITFYHILYSLYCNNHTSYQSTQKSKNIKARAIVKKEIKIEGEQRKRDRDGHSEH